MTTLSEESIKNIIHSEIQKIIPILEQNITNELLKLIVVQEDICPKKEIAKSSEESSSEESPPKKEEPLPKYTKKELEGKIIVELKSIASKLNISLGKNTKKADIIKLILEKIPKEKAPTKEKEFIVIKNTHGIYVDKDTGRYIIDKDTNSIVGIFKGKDNYGPLLKKDLDLLSKQGFPLYHIKINKKKPLTTKEIKILLEKESSSEQLLEEESSSESSSEESSVEEEKKILKEVESSSEESSSEEVSEKSSSDDESDDGSEEETQRKKESELKTIEEIFKESFGSKISEDTVPKKVQNIIPPKEEPPPSKKITVVPPPQPTKKPPTKKLVKKKIESDDESD